MKHTALPSVAHRLSPRDAAWLAGTIARNQARFAGWSMDASDNTGDASDKTTSETDLSAEDQAKAGRQRALERSQQVKAKIAGAGDKPLGENGEKALKAERDARKALEGELSDLKKGLAAALGLGGDDDKPDDGDTLAQIQQQIADIKREKDVLALANKHRITDEGDLALLAATSDQEARKKLAERLAPAEEERDAKSRRPKPDRSQGGGGSDSGQSGGKSVAQVIADRRAARAAKATSNT